MAKAGPSLMGIIIWVVGVIVSLAVGFGMIGGALTVPYLEAMVPIAGWVVVVGTIIGVVMAIVQR